MLEKSVNAASPAKLNAMVAREGPPPLSAALIKAISSALLAPLIIPVGIAKASVPREARIRSPISFMFFAPSL
jgi:hypothetical protein